MVDLVTGYLVKPFGHGYKNDSHAW